MNLHFESVDSGNQREIIELKILKEQEGMVETVEECLDEARERPEWNPVGVYDDEILVGFAMYGLFIESKIHEELWLDRFLIDRKYQARGYGRAVISKLIRDLYKKYRSEKLYLSVYDGNDIAIDLYKKLAFKFNGRLDINGEKIMVYIY